MFCDNWSHKGDFFQVSTWGWRNTTKSALRLTMPSLWLRVVLILEVTNSRLHCILLIHLQFSIKNCKKHIILVSFRKFKINFDESISYELQMENCSQFGNLSFLCFASIWLDGGDLWHRTNIWLENWCQRIIK